MGYEDSVLLKIVNREGYILQQAIEEVVWATENNRRGAWRVESTEHHWEDNDNDQSGYADLIIEHKSKNLVGILECKRYSEETPWIFLCPDVSREYSQQSSLRWAQRIGEYDVHPKGGWESFVHDPLTYEARFCVVQGQNNERPMLERIAGQLLYSVDAIATQYAWLPSNTNFIGAVFLPIIVTTAKLYVCLYSQKELDPKTGIIEESKAKFVEVPFIRFTKVFTNASNNLDAAVSIGQIENIQRQTVVVTTSTGLSSFLSNCTEVFDRNQNRNLPWRR